MTIYSHRDDLDGVVAATIAGVYYPEADIVPIRYADLDQITQFPAVILDLELPPTHPALLRKDTFVIDHHPGTGVLNVPARIVFKDCFSAAELAWQQWGALLTDGDYRHLSKWAYLADLGDRWLVGHPDFLWVRKLSALMRSVGFDRMRGMVHTHPADSQTMLTRAELAWEIEQRQNAAATELAIETAIKQEGGWHLAICYQGSPSEVCYDVCRALGPEATVALVNLPAFRAGDSHLPVSVRGPRALEVAQSMGGGGHAHAAGFSLPRTALASLVGAA